MLSIRFNMNYRIKNTDRIKLKNLNSFFNTFSVTGRWYRSLNKYSKLYPFLYKNEYKTDNIDYFQYIFTNILRNANPVA